MDSAVFEMRPRRRGERLRLLVRFGYSGSRFHGLQPQGELPTAGLALANRLRDAAGVRPSALCFAARTDAGVHAIENIATAVFRAPVDAAGLIQRLCVAGDDGLLAVRAAWVPLRVHARTIAVGKYYRYVIEDGAPVARTAPHAVWSVVPRLDGPSMAAASIAFVGTQDFTSFRARRCGAGSTLKTIWRCDVESVTLPSGSQRHTFHIEGTSFLRKMVRIMVGSLVEVGAGFRASDELAAVLAARRRCDAGLTAPACGLTLVRVLLPQPWSGLWHV